MFGSFSSPHTLAAPTAASLQVSTTTHEATPTSPTSPTRSSRLRGLSYLRSYTHNHLHHHSPGSDSSSPSRPTLSRSNSTPTGHRRQSSRSAQPVHTPQPRQPDQGHISPIPQRNNNTARGDSPTSGWLPTVGGQSLSRVAPQPQPTPSSTSQTATMTRSRAATSADEQPTIAGAESTPAPVVLAPAPPLERSATETAISKKDAMPTIRLIPHQDPHSAKPSLNFNIVTRTLASSSARVRVGRYSERDGQAVDALTNPHSTSPIGFKSKVVSRRHCEFWCDNGQWFIKDVRSSSGTFLNHVRLSSPGMESRVYPVNDGDIVQLGIDFKGGEEAIFRCVKIRVECNRGWQKSLNQFNTSTHKRLLKRTQSGPTKDSDAQSSHSSECSICLCPVAPCQALFVAPCSHVWHYKCIRTVIYPKWPMFQCPNCRAYADLEADVDEQEEEEFEDMDDAVDEPQDTATQQTGTNTASADTDDMDQTVMNLTGLSVGDTSRPPTESSNSDDDDDDDEASSTATTRPLPIAASTNAPVNSALPESIMARSATPTSTTQFALAAGIMNDGPATPMNDAGPFLFDGGSARRPRPVDRIAREAVHEEAEDITQ